MSRPPNAPSAPLLGRALLARIGWLGLVITAVTLGYFAWEVSRGRPLPEARTAAFTLLAFCEWANVLNVRSETRSVLSSPVWKNRWLLGGLAASVALQGRSSTGRPSCGSSAPCTCRRARSGCWRCSGAPSSWPRRRARPSSAGGCGSGGRVTAGLLFLAASAALVVAGTWLARAADAIAERTGIGRVSIGTVLLAAATSLPELASDVAAVRQGNPDLAAGDLLGSSMANMLILALLDSLVAPAPRPPQCIRPARPLGQPGDRAHGHRRRRPARAPASELPGHRRLLGDPGRGLRGGAVFASTTAHRTSRPRPACTVTCVPVPRLRRRRHRRRHRRPGLRVVRRHAGCDDRGRPDLPGRARCSR